MAAVASRSALVGALLRTSSPSARHLVVDFLRGLSAGELECLAEFQGSFVLEVAANPRFSPYQLVRDFFDPSVSDRWQNADDRAHKTLIVLSWLEQSTPSITVHVRTC